ncbi:DUF5685 family protein [Methanomassiliicoccus luminyensis]|jgi:hypothetical protein|uniref:DUF5685 family protein n=1 Tax=Methanomassiliicoccus luminyensis TaxID=1080712 RepID=UPI00036C0386|nr:DUF5685 family protein [Methanomassiliicoccus luminyensis]
MFGYVAADLQALSEEERDRYRKHYCGLCYQLDARYASAGRASLTYDMTFLNILLSSLYDLEEVQGSQHCVCHPLKQHPYIVTPATVYAADISILLAYYQCLDDWNDDHDPVARKKNKVLEKYLGSIEGSNPRQYQAVTDSMRQLGRMEQANELNPDLPANCFGELMGTLLVWRQDEYADTLWHMGAALGRFIYLLDAVNDLKADIKKQRYNPLVAQMNSDFMPALTMIMAECTAEFERLPIERDRRILQDHLYSGVWQNYRVRRKRGMDA